MPRGKLVADKQGKSGGPWKWHQNECCNSLEREKEHQERKLYDVAEEGQENVRRLQKKVSEPCCSHHMRKEVHNIVKAQTVEKRKKQDESLDSSYHV